MIFNKIKLQNFRQYKKAFEIDLATPSNNKNNITLIMGENGVGKTTLLQSVRYCFFGASSNYLNLPDLSKILNHDLVNELKQGDTAIMFVEVTFTHDGKTYIARREQEYVKTRNNMNNKAQEMFFLKESNDENGFTDVPEEERVVKMNSIMPPGLSYIFMFDGERMERNISDPSFKTDINESILGILNIKQYDELIDLLGHKGRSSSVIGRLNSRKSGESKREDEILKRNSRYEEQKTMLEEEIKVLDEKIFKYQDDIKDAEKHQAKIIEIELEHKKRDVILREFDLVERSIDELSKKYLSDSMDTYIDLLLLEQKPRYNKFINKKDTGLLIYRNLHTDTIEDILDKNICLCGENISGNSSKRENVNKLKQVALPFETGHYLTSIEERFFQANESEESLKLLENIMKEINGQKRNKRKLNIELQNITDKIRDLEKVNNIDYSTMIDHANKMIADLNIKKGEKINLIKVLTINIKKLEREVKEIEEKSESNKELNKLIHEVERIKYELKKTRDLKNKEAREILEKHFQESLTQVMQGKHYVKIDDIYNINILDNNNIDVSNRLSTGQKVVVSLSLITALINTAKELSDQINIDDKYGIIMDAALSNLDSTHISRVSKFNLINMEQLIFLSFKKQLENDLIASIGDNVGKAYELFIEEDGSGINKKEIDLDELAQYINESEVN